MAFGIWWRPPTFATREGKTLLVVLHTSKGSIIYHKDTYIWTAERATMNKLRSFCGNPIQRNPIQLTQISLECPRVPLRRGEGLPQFHHSQYFLYKLTISWENIKFHRHRVQNVLGSRIGLKNRLFDKKSVVFHRAESRWCQVCNLLCQFLTRSQFGRSRPCEKWTEKNGKGEQEVGNVRLG